METQSKVLKWSIIIGIIIVLNLLFNYALSLAYRDPQYEAYCPTSQVVNIPDNQASCVDQGGQWTNDPNYTKPVMVGEKPILGYCDLQYTCRQDFDTANKSYNRNVFAVLVLLGALSVLIGNFFKGNDVISNGLALGGVLSFVIASMRYWGSADNLIKVIILAIAFAMLVWIAMKKFKN